MGPVGPRLAPCRPHEPCYQGLLVMAPVVILKARLVEVWKGKGIYRREFIIISMELLKMLTFVFGIGMERFERNSLRRRMSGTLRNFSGIWLIIFPYFLSSSHSLEATYIDIFLIWTNTKTMGKGNHCTFNWNIILVRELRQSYIENISFRVCQKLESNC